MKLGKVFASAALAMSLASAPVAAQAAAAADSARVESSVEGEKLAGSFLIPVLAAIALAIGIWLIVDDGDDDPVSV